MPEVRRAIALYTRSRFDLPKILLVVAALSLSACATLSPLEGYPAKPVDLREAMLVLSPGAGAILGVVQTGYANAIEQTISLATNARAPGQNYLKVQIFEATGDSKAPGALADTALADLDMAGEARGKVSFADMKLSPFFVQNQYGPFGYSMGRTETSDTCMYAWQRIGPSLKRTGAGARGAVTLRALICDSKKTEHELLQIMFDLRIKGVTGVVAPAPRTIGASGTVISPFAVDGAANVLSPLPVAENHKPAPQPAKVSEEITGSVTPRLFIPEPSVQQAMPIVPQPSAQQSLPIVPQP